MIEINVKTDVADAIRGLDAIQRKQVPFATAVALTRTAKLVETNLQKDMATGFDSASPYSLRSTFSTMAKKTDLQATIGIKDKKPAGGTAPAVLLKEHFDGTQRGNKPMEKAMIALGAMPAGWHAMPGAGLPLNTYGNPKRAIVGEILGALRSRQQIYKGRGKRTTMVGYFVVAVGVASHLVPGIYLRKGREIRPMFVFVKDTHYRKRFDLPTIANKVVAHDFDALFAKELNNAIATAR